MAEASRVIGVDFGAPVGAKNAYLCPDCDRFTVIVHVDAGVTPMFLACRADGLDPVEAICKGRSFSTQYQPEPWPETDPTGRPIPTVPTWEWFAETDAQREGNEALSLRRIGPSAADAPETFWQGKPAKARRVLVIVGPSDLLPGHSGYWASDIVGQERLAVEVRIDYGKRLFYLDDVDGSAWRAVTIGQGRGPVRGMNVERVVREVTG